MDSKNVFYCGTYLVLSLILFMFLKQVLDRGEKIELLVDKTENLHSQVSKFNR